MNIIKTFSRTGYVISPLVLSGVALNNCGLVVFASESQAEGLDRENIFRNFTQAARYRDDKPYSILMDDDVVLGPGAIVELLSGLVDHDAATLPVDGKRTRTQHAILAIKNEVLDRYPFQLFNKNICNQCVYVAHLIDKLGAKVNALRSPMQRTIKRLILKKDFKNE